MLINKKILSVTPSFTQKKMIYKFIKINTSITSILIFDELSASITIDQ